jgi:hypothetical protein
MKRLKLHQAPQKYQKRGALPADNFEGEREGLRVQHGVGKPGWHDAI